MKGVVSIGEIDFEIVQVGEVQVYSGRDDVDFAGNLTINGRKLPFKLHLFREQRGRQSGEWYASMSINEKPYGAMGNKEEGFPDLQEECCECGNDSPVALAVAAKIHKWLNECGYKIAPGVGNTRVKVNGRYTMSKSPWWIFHVYVDSQGPVKYGKSRRQMYHKETRKVVSPIYGEYTLVKEESSL
jgi:hypothetical protein